MQVEQVLATEELLYIITKYLPRKWKRCKPYREVYPNKKTKALKSLSFILWEGDHYDNINVLKKVLKPEEV